MKTQQVTKIKGEVVDEVGILRQIRTWFSDASNGNYLISFERVKRPRSNDQNRLMWVWFTCIARSWSEATGIAFTRENVHDAYCLKFLPITLPNGNNIAGSTSKLTTEQMTDFLNKVQADAATEYGIKLLSLTDIHYEEWAKQYLH